MGREREREREGEREREMLPEIRHIHSLCFSNNASFFSTPAFPSLPHKQQNTNSLPPNLTCVDHFDMHRYLRPRRNDQHPPSPPPLPLFPCLQQNDEADEERSVPSPPPPSPPPLYRCCPRTPGCLSTSFPFPFLCIGIVASPGLIELSQTGPLFPLCRDLPLESEAPTVRERRLNCSFGVFARCGVVGRGGIWPEMSGSKC